MQLSRHLIPLSTVYAMMHISDVNVFTLSLNVFALSFLPYPRMCVYKSPGKDPRIYQEPLGPEQIWSTSE